MPSGSYKKKAKTPKQMRNARPAGLDDYIHDIGKFPVKAEINSRYPTLISYPNQPVYPNQAWTALGG